MLPKSYWAVIMSNHTQLRAILIPELHAIRPPEQAGGYSRMHELTRLWLSIRRNADVRSFLRLRCVSFTFFQCLLQSYSSHAQR